MAHYAFLDENNVVVAVMPGHDESEETDWERIYSEARGLRCKRTSYNTVGGVHIEGKQPFRHTYAGEGFIYVDEIDAFVPPKPGINWTLNLTNKSWDPPIPYPADDKLYRWDEASQSWIEMVENNDPE
jgi:hypothetical protein